MQQTFRVPQPPSRKIFHRPHADDLVTIEPCLAEASQIIEQLRKQVTQPSNRRLQAAFTALADGDAALGLLAFYLWRRRARCQT